MFSFLKDLALVTVGPRVGRHYGDFVARNIATGWRPRYRARRRRVHRGRGAAGFPATGAWDSVGASTRGLHRTRFAFVGHRNKALDSGSPFVEFPRSGRKIEEQLCVRQGFCCRWWQRNLHGSRRASTSDHVRRSSITTPRSHAIFTSASASGRVFYVPGVALGALPAVVSGIFGVITPFVARRLGGARC